MWFLVGEVSSSSGYLGWAVLFYCGTPGAFDIIILIVEEFIMEEKSSRNSFCLSYSHLLSHIENIRGGIKKFVH